jgi:hypothetical protein
VRQGPEKSEGKLMSKPASNKIQEEKSWAIPRLKQFLADLEKADTDLDIEVEFYKIYTTARRAYTVAHLINGKVKIEEEKS